MADCDPVLLGTTWTHSHIFGNATALLRQCRFMACDRHDPAWRHEIANPGDAGNSVLTTNFSEVEREADRFAAELLMPQRDIRHQLDGLNIS